MMREEFWGNDKKIRNFVYTYSLPKLYDPDSTFYPHTLMLPVLKSGINFIDDEWHLRIWKSDSELKNKLCILEVIEEEMDDPIIIELYLYNSLCEFRSMSSIKLCTCKKFKPFTGVILKSGSVGASLYISRSLLKKHDNCYGGVFKLLIYISISNVEFGNGFKNPIIQKDLRLLSVQNILYFTIIVEEKKFLCTGWKWAGLSSLFRALFRKMLQNNEHYFEIKGIYVDEFQATWNNVEFAIFTDDIEVHRQMAIAHFFQLDLIKYSLASKVMHTIDCNSWYHIFIVADKLELPELKRAAMSVGYLDYTSPKKNLGFDKISYFFNGKIQLVKQITRYSADLKRSKNQTQLQF